MNICPTKAWTRTFLVCVQYISPAPLGYLLSSAQRDLKCNQILADPLIRVQLDWNRRFNIIEGIAQGILYLHMYSRFKVVHRDMKASNILLDSEMNPKISDLGWPEYLDRTSTKPALEG